jgi:hypothetical protein
LLVLTNAVPTRIEVTAALMHLNLSERLSARARKLSFRNRRFFFGGGDPTTVKKIDRGGNELGFENSGFRIQDSRFRVIQDLGFAKLFDLES